MNDWSTSWSMLRWPEWMAKSNGYCKVRLSRADDNVRLFYEFYAQTRVGGKWLCVVVKYLPDDAFVITAYLTETIKAGETLWPKK
jgi:hypothetical protein